ncbi:hypothetical protein GO755_40475 [Spirosoma sp. HMF4905]|uniref:Uncharacterized protein n=1 Tax=Spirosoma arboris TaxID=2682092 RepID=A0A7K1SRD6_9BACT|nr:hypothetical protein [Spirosoma arboris]MVM36349.1 hypothetical protein [Spirosoma arboris]
MAKETLSLRLPGDSLSQIEELKPLFGPSAAKVVERAIAYLHENKIAVAEIDHQQRITRLG